MLERLRHPEVRYALLAMLGALVAAAVAMRLWHASLRVPLFPNGDGLYALMQIKGVIDNGWVLSNDYLGAPFGQDLYDFAANRELLNVLIVKVLALFSSNPATIYNVYYVASFPLIGLASYVVMRWLGISRWVAVAMSVLFAVAPFHFRHATFLAAFFTVPLGAYLVLAIYSEQPLLGARRRTLLTVAAAVAVALSSFYFAAFTVLLVLMATAITFVASRRRSTLVAGAVVVGVILAAGVIAQTPDLIYDAQHGANSTATQRGANESEFFSTNFVQLVMPVPQHRIGPLADLSARWQSESRINAEATHLGLLAALGFVWLLLVALAAAAGARGRLVADRRQRHLAVATLTALLLGTTGGLSGLIAYTVTTQLRTWTRLSIFIAFFALCAIGLLLDALLEWLRGRELRAPRIVTAVLLLVVVGLAFLDQTTQSNIPTYDSDAAAYRSDAAFAETIESTAGDDAMVLELPYVSFPEGSDVGGTRSYDHVRPYLHTESARWSFGAMKGRPEDWQADTAGAPPDELVPAVAAAGFDGIYVDRFGYPAFATGLESDLQQVVGTPPLASSDGRFSFFDLRDYRERLAGELTQAQIAALGDATVRPVRTDWGDAFTQRQQEGLDSARWTNVADATLELSNPSSETRPSELFVKLARPGGDAAQVTITYPDGSTERVEVPPEGKEVERSLSIRPGESAVRISTDGASVAGSRDGPGGYVQLLGWRITPSVP